MNKEQNVTVALHSMCRIMSNDVYSAATAKKDASKIYF